MECKFKSALGVTLFPAELIDTLWNVNVFLMDGRTSPATQN